MVFIKFYSPSNCETLTVDLKSSIKEIKNDPILKKDDRNLEDYDIFYAGKKLSDDVTLENVQALNDNSTIFAFRKPTNAITQPSPPTGEELETLLSSLQATLMEPHHRALLNRISGNPETLQNLIDCVPGLRQDTVAQAVVKDPLLLLHWVDDENAIQNFLKHPSLFLACQQIVEHLHAEVMRHSGSANSVLFPPPPPDVAVGDPFDDDEDDEENADGANNPALRQQITAQHLANALATATFGGIIPPAGGNGSRAPANVAPPTAGPSAATASLITRDMFMQAIQQAAQPNAPQPPVARHVNYEDQLGGLRDMGFTNEEENMRALRASNGDFQAALEFIINERERLEQGFGLD